ncbi:rhomboid family intramembrane serine protease [Peribacillus sp. SCS-155]|uniref:rhomboid family intramembrane serine protease n=1 Tax=Peribacillus sedimenti TaxID=3115297 RepID=UPI003906A9DE
MLFIRRETFREYLRVYPVTSLIVALCTAVMLIDYIFSLFYNQNLLFRFGLNRGFVFGGEYFRMVTYAFFHAGAGHLLSNMFFTIVFAPAIERLIGRIKFVFLFFWSILAAALLNLLLDSHTLVVGESGFGFSLFGFYLYIILYKKHMIDPASKSTILMFMALGWFSTFIFPEVSMVSHIGGFAAGWLFAFILGQNRNGFQMMQRSNRM